MFLSNSIDMMKNLPLVEIGLTDMPKSGGAMAPPGTPRDDTPDVHSGIFYQQFLPPPVQSKNIGNNLGI